MYQIEKLVPEIEAVVAEVRADYIINNEIIRDDVFEILEKHCTVMYYPIEDKNNGFHAKRIVGENLQDFVYINTAKETELQVFTAAHELGHIWGVAQKVWERMGYSKEDLTEKWEEDITDRFAAELLMPYDIFKKSCLTKYEDYGHTDGKIEWEELIQLIVFQMNTFLTPYESVCRRLVETQIIDREVKRYLEKYEDEILRKVKIYAAEQNFRLGVGQKRKAIANIRELLEEAEKRETLSKKRIEQIKRDFDIKDIAAQESMVEIQLGRKPDGEKAGSSH